MLDMKLTKNNLIKKLGESNSEVIEVVTKYNKLLPILSEDGEGFCVSAKDLHKQLQVGRDYTTWIKDRIKKYDFINNEDYIEYWVKDDIIFFDELCYQFIEIRFYLLFQKDDENVFFF